MFSLRRKIKSSQADAPPSQESGDSVARVALTEEGTIAYASAAFRALAGAMNDGAANESASVALRFPLATQMLRDLSGGAHKVAIGTQEKLHDFHFDWMPAPGGRRYLVGSKLDESAGAKLVPPTDDFRPFMALSQEAMLVADEFGEILKVNDALKNLFGYDEDELEKMNLLDLFHAQDRPYIRNAVLSFTLGDEERGDAEGPMLDFEARAVTKSGEERAMEWRQVRSSGLTYCAGRDLTSVRRQERALIRREEQLKEAESIGRMGRWRWGIGEDSVDWSDEIYRMFGVERGKFQPTLDSMRDFVNRRDIARVNQALQRAIIERNDYGMEFRIARLDGGTRYIRCEGRCAVNAEGEAIALYGIMQDVTERVLHEKELREAKDAAERAYAAKSQFLANMSHELRTPLNAVIGFSEMMQRQLLGPIGTEKYLEYIKGIRESGEHLLDIINDILVMSKIEAGKYELALEEINILKIVHLAAHMMEGKAMDADVKIAVETPPNPNRIIIADRRAVLQVILNLLSNAVKFSPRGGDVRVECHDAAPSRGEFVIIKVIDRGIGIPANKLATITRPFEQASSHYAREHEGTGLGLAITKDLIEMHGGALQIESTVNVGTTVNVRLPFDGSKAKK